MPGPPPKPNAERRRRNTPRANTVKLPAEGRVGPTPRWPMPTFAPDAWEDIWKLPQAVMWEHMGAEPIVARYIDLRDKVMNPEFPEGKTASFWGALVALEDRLGLTPTAMMKLQWEIDGTTEDSTDGVTSVDHAGATVTRMDEVKKRLKKGGS